MTTPAARWRLANGLQIQLFPDDRYGRVGVCTTFGVGMRHEEPGWEGVAHLVEHLLFEGSAHVPQGQLRRTTHDAGGVVNGTTHLDYTDYYQAVPGELLQQVLFQEADRFAVPLLEPALAEQLEVVEAEINQTSRAWPLGDLPWPVLPMSIHQQHANAHDGYGRPERLRNLSGDECRSFFERHYAPSRAVLTVMGDFDEERTAGWIEEYFGVIPERETSPTLDLAEPVAPQWKQWEEPLLTTPVSMWGFALPDPVESLHDYTAALVVCELVAAASPVPDLVTSAATGFFGPFDARDPDTLVLMASGEDRIAQSPDQLAHQLLSAAAALGNDAIDEARGRAVRRLDEARSGLVSQVRELSRAQQVFGDHDLVARGAAALTKVSNARVLACIDTLRAQPLRGATVTPSTRRRRPIDRNVPRTVVAPRASRAERPIPAPAAAEPRHVTAPALASAQRPWGKIIAARDTRSPKVSIGMRIPLGDPGWQVAEPILHAATGAIASHLRSRCTPDQSARVTTHGQWLDIDLTCDPTNVTSAVENLVNALEAEPKDGSSPTATRWDGTEILEHVLRLNWGTTDAVKSQPEEVIDGLRVDEAATIIIGPVDPDLVVNQLNDVSGPHRVRHERPHGIHLTGSFHVAASGKPDVDVLLAFPEADVDPEAESRRLLAAAATAGYRASRLGRRIKANGDGYGFTFGRGLVREQPVSVVRASIRQDAAPSVAADLAHLVEQSTKALTDNEIDRARSYCRWQSKQMFDSPEILAATLRTMVSRSLPTDWPWQMAERLAETTSTEVRRGACELFEQGFFVVSWGDGPSHFEPWPPSHATIDGGSDV